MVHEDFIDPEKRRMKSYFVVVIYDISDNRKRYRLHKCMEGYGEWVQRSAFECYVTNTQLEEMKAELKELIDPGIDLLRIYKISHSPLVWTYGRIGVSPDEDYVIL